MFRIGARIVAVPAKNGALDALRGTQHLLTQAGRDILAAQYQAGYVAGAQVRAHRRCPRAPVQPTPPPPTHPPSHTSSNVPRTSSGCERPACGILSCAVAVLAHRLS